MPAHSVHRFWRGRRQQGASWLRSVVIETQRCPVTDWIPTDVPAEVRWILSRPGAREQSNCFRYWALWRYGGLWLDHDVIPLANLRGASRPWTAAVDGRREGAIMWFPRPGHPMLAELLKRAEADPDLATGASLLEEVGTAYHGQVDLEHRVLPFDAAGVPTAGVHRPLAVHLWTTTGARR